MAKEDRIINILENTTDPQALLSATVFESGFVRQWGKFTFPATLNSSFSTPNKNLLVPIDVTRAHSVAVHAMGMSNVTHQNAIPLRIYGFTFSAAGISFQIISQNNLYIQAMEYGATDFIIGWALEGFSL